YLNLIEKGLMKKYIICVIMLVALVFSNCMKTKAETKGVEELNPYRHQSRVIHVRKYTNKTVSFKAGNILHIETDDTSVSEGRKLILRTEISDNSILEKVKIGTKVDFYGSSGFIPGSYTCKDTISLFTEGGITIPEEGNKYDRKLYGKIINNDGLPETILIEFDKKVVTFQELDLKVRKALYDKKTLVSR
ncbi:TPA: hypothetical protein ACUBX6_001069, partial [Streptococcus agalactiae]